MWSYRICIVFTKELVISHLHWFYKGIDPTSFALVLLRNVIISHLHCIYKGIWSYRICIEFTKEIDHIAFALILQRNWSYVICIGFTKECEHIAFALNLLRNRALYDLYCIYEGNCVYSIIVDRRASNRSAYLWILSLNKWVHQIFTITDVFAFRWIYSNPHCARWRQHVFLVKIHENSQITKLSIHRPAQHRHLQRRRLCPEMHYVHWNGSIICSGGSVCVRSDIMYIET